MSETPGSLTALLRDLRADLRLGMPTLVRLILAVAIGLWCGLLAWDLGTDAAGTSGSLIHMDNPVNELTGLWLALGGLFALRAAWLLARRGGRLRPYALVVVAMACGFFLAGYDELFEFHEHFGTYVLRLYLVAALVAMPFVFGLVRRFPVVAVALGAGVALQALALLCEDRYQFAAEELAPWVYVAYLEESGEYFAAMFYLIAMVLLCHRLARRLPPSRTPRPAERAAAEPAAA